MLAFICLLPALRADTISVTASCPLSSLVKDISRLTGLPISPEGLGGVQMVVNVKDAPVLPLLQDIADALDADLRKRGDTIIFQRETERKNLALERETAARTEWLKKRMPELLAERKGLDDWSDQAIKSRESKDDARGQGGGANEVRVFAAARGGPEPADLFLNEALRQMRPDVLAAVQPGTRVVFASNPNRMQKGLPYSTRVADAFLKAYHKTGKPAPAVAEGTIVFGGPAPYDASARGVGKVLLIASRSGDSLTLEVKAGGLNGNMLAQTTMDLGEPPAPKPRFAPSADKSLDVAPSLVTLAKDLSTASQLRQTLWEFSSGGSSVRISIGLDLAQQGSQAPTPASPESIAAVSKPTQRDPNTLFAPDLLARAAAEEKKEIVAAIPDTSFVPFVEACKTGKVSSKKLLEGVTFGLDVHENSGRLVVKPLVPAEEDRQAVSRAAMERVITGEQSRGFSKPDEYCLYTLQIRQFDGMDQAVLGLAAPNAASFLGQESQLKKYRVYGSLNDSTRASTQPRQMLDYASLSEKQRGFLLAALLDDGAGLPPQFRLVAFMPQLRTGNPQTLAGSEPTEQYPDGLPGNTVYSIQKSWTEGVLATTAGGKKSLKSAPELVDYLPGSTTAPTSPSERLAKLQTARMVYIQTGALFGRPGPGGAGSTSASATMTDAELSGPVVTDISGLPEAMQQQIRRAAAQMARARQRQQIDGGGGG